jgi:type IV pilus assembly protein PilE
MARSVTDFIISAMSSRLTAPSRDPRQHGYTLIELMIVVVVIGVLAIVAFPSFMDQVRASRRSEAIATLSLIQQAQERWRANCPCYAASLTAAPNGGSPTGCPATDCANTAGLGLTLSNPRYNFSLTTVPATATPNTYALAASAVGGQAQDRAGATSCTTLTVTVTNGIPVNSPAACFRQ